MTANAALRAKASSATTRTRTVTLNWIRSIRTTSDGTHSLPTSMNGTRSLSTGIFGNSTNHHWVAPFETMASGGGPTNQRTLMLTTDLIREIDRLLQTGELSRRRIADHLGVSRGTANSVANGHRGLHGRGPNSHYSPLPSSPPVRCGRCGYRVYLPFIICRVRDHKHRQQLLQILAAQQRKTLEKSARRQMPPAPRDAA